ncbi:MAG: DUF1015 domain-containing protein [Thermoplasmatales archaeon]|nr:DUF1015 domain-containing protein [Thermoplasmatales archaeon]
MVVFLPFEGVRPALKGSEKIDDRISPPYDVIGEKHLAELQSKKGNVTRFTLLPENGRYGKAREELDGMIADGSLAFDPPSFYLYRQTFDEHGRRMARTGIVGRLKTEDYSKGNVMPHEETFSKVKEDRLNLLRDVETHLESIFGIFTGLPKGLWDTIHESARPLYIYEDPAGVTHEYLGISDPDVTHEITKALADQKMLIADGHHRYETALNYSRENPGDERKSFVLATLVAEDDPGMVIWPTHRVVNRPDVDERTLVGRLGKELSVAGPMGEKEFRERLGDHLMGFAFTSGNFYLADCPRKDGLWSLDTYAVQEAVLKNALGTDGAGKEVTYDAEIDSAISKALDGEASVSIILNDPSFETIWDLAGKGLRMPKKTTFFYPKIWSGFVFYRMV